MSSIEIHAQDPRVQRASKASIIFWLAAAGLFLGSAALQGAASLQRWATFRDAHPENEILAEDHVFDYCFPDDAWERIGTAAQLHGAGVLVLVLGLTALAFGVWALPGAPARRRGIAGLARAGFEVVLVGLVTASFALSGSHALLSGVAGTATGLQDYFWAPALVALAGLIALGALWRGTSPAAMAACFFLLGSTLLGYLLAAFLIAPVFAGYVSHDTTPWTESVIAASTAAAGFCMIFAVWTAVRRRAHRTSAVTPSPGQAGISTP